VKREILVGAWEEAVAACDAGLLARAALARDPRRYDAVLALGKAALALRDGALSVPACAGVAESLAITGAGTPHAGPHEVLIGEHPVPGPGSFAAGARALAWCRAARARGLRVLGLVSGGASALCEAPVAGLTTTDLARAHRALVASGAPIAAMNAARRRLSAVKGGGLAEALGPALARVLVLADVASGDPRVVGSGPLSAPPPEAEAGAAALSVALAALGITQLPPGSSGVEAPLPEVLASPATLAEGLVAALSARGVAAAAPEVLEAPLEGVVDRVVRHLIERREAWVAAGEVGVTVPPGAVGSDGGRARHLALAVRVAMARAAPDARWWFLAAGSDGRDGAGAAGAVLGHETRVAGAEAALAGFASGPWLRAAGCELAETPPRTNVTDGYVAVAW